MAIGVVKLSKKQRGAISVLFVSLNLIQVLGGITMVVLSIYIYIAVAPILYSERAEISFVFLVVGICGVNTTLNNLFGVKIHQKCLKQSHKKSTRNLIFFWTCASFYIVFYLVLLASMSRKMYKHMIRSMKHSFHIGMTKYLKNSLWKVTIDRIQFDLQCCGIKNYTEWHEIEWLYKDQLDEKSEIVKELRGSEDRWIFPVTPWSCCRLSFPMQCLHDPLQQTRSENVWADRHALVLESINQEGCIEKLKGPIYAATTLFILLVVLNCIIQVIICPVVRILYTSCRNALLLDDPDGVAPGWIFGRGDFGYNRGPTLLDIMTRKRRSRSRKRTPKEEETDLLDDTPR